jgi:hypothetical protein
MCDSLKGALFVGITAVSIGLACLSFFVWNSLASRNLAFAFSALIGAVFLFGLQLLFELQSTSTTDFFSAELTLDRAGPRIRQWTYPPPSPKDPGLRLSYEEGASAYLATSDPVRFNGDGERLTHDMLVFSLASHLASEQSDWQQRRTVFQGRTAGALITRERVSKPDECTSFSESDIQSKLAEADNAFAKAHIGVPGELCLPPKTTLTITASGLKIVTPFCSISFNLEPSRGVFYSEPGTNGMKSGMTNGLNTFETRITGIRAVVRFDALRAQHKDMKKYEEWSTRLVDSTRIWFEGSN